MDELHISDIRSFKSCRRKWNFSSPLRRGLESNTPYAPFLTGRAIHHAIEMYYGSGQLLLDALGEFFENEIKEMGTLWPAEEEMVQEQIELSSGILEHYGQWLGRDAGRLDDKNLEFIALETEFSVPLRNPKGRKSNKIRLAGRFDGLVRIIDEDTYWIWENKTARSITELERSLANDEQCGAYMYAAQEIFDVPITGVLYNILRKKVPTYPRALNDGLLSRAKSIDTTVWAYAKAIRTHHPDWEQDTMWDFYGEVLEHLDMKGNTFFARLPVYRTPSEIQELVLNIWYVGLEMTRASTRLYPSPSWLNCNFCTFKSVCLAMNAGADYEFILSEEFRKRVAAVSWRQAESVTRAT